MSARPLLTALPLVLCAAVVSPLRADEANGGEETAVTTPTFSVENLVPDKETLNEGWKVLEEDPPAGDPSEGALMALAQAHGLNEDTAYVEARVMQTPAGAKGGIAMMDVDGDAAPFAKALQAKAGEANWTVRTLGVADRLLVVGGGAARDEIAAEMVAHLVQRFTAWARTRLNINTYDKAEAKAARAAVRGLVRAGREISPNAAAFHAIESFAHMRAYAKKKGEADRAKERLKKAKDDAEEDELLEKQRKAKEAYKASLAKCFKHARKALAPDAVHPPRGTLLTSLAGQAAGLLLEQKEDRFNEEALPWLKIAVDGEALNMPRKFEDRYNLACTYARLDKKDEAFHWLRQSLETGLLLPWERYGKSFVHMEEKDEDMKPLRDDPRWAPLVKEFRSDKVEKYVKEKKKQEERQKREAEKRKKNASSG